MNFTNDIETYYKELKATIDKFDVTELDKVMNVLYDAYENEATIYTCGNGGSASTASHMMNDFNKGISYDLEKKWHITCLNDNIATIMAIANDDSYDKVFSKQLEGNIKKGDVLLAISGSGNSANIIEAVNEAKKAGATVIGMTGYTGGKLYEMSHVHMHVDINDMQITEDLHLTFNHMMMRIFSRLQNK
ncbi:MAG: SIS domain-containing protein [Streptococcaceae bacterium]|nr:SIS domain-containing protein [Streptococcaceae bacterium]MCL2680969.1 SIS domain-containing protein [Streptococcaceae bacterium]